MDPIFVTIGNILLLEWVGLRGGHLVGKHAGPPLPPPGPLGPGVSESLAPVADTAGSLTEEQVHARDP